MVRNYAHKTRLQISLREKCPNSGPYFLVFRLNTEMYGVNLRIEFKYRKIRNTKIRNNSVFGHFSRSIYSLRYKTTEAKSDTSRTVKILISSTIIQFDRFF